MHGSLPTLLTDWTSYAIDKECGAAYRRYEKARRQQYLAYFAQYPELPQPPDDLEGRVRLACAGGHDEQDALFTPRDGVHGAVDGDQLVVARQLA